jgi:hypothetical protein
MFGKQCLITILVMVFSAPVWADEQVAEGCACVSKEQTYEQGETACILGKRMRCAMSQNISSWEATGESCEISDLRDVNQSAVVTAM